MNGLEILSPGSGASVQDLGRPGWKRFGVPAGGAMDRDAAVTANRLVANPPEAPVIEGYLSGLRLRARGDLEVALAGGHAECTHPAGRRLRLADGEEISLGAMRRGAWTYVAVRGGLAVPRWLGSASVNPRAAFGRWLRAGDLIEVAANSPTSDVPRMSHMSCMSHVPPADGAFRVSPGWHWDLFAAASREAFFATAWTVSRHSDRSGTRLEGAAGLAHAHDLASFPVAEGCVQVPPDGRPIVILRDGPTVGGYPQLVGIDRADLSRLAQCAPGDTVRFVPA